MDIDLYFSIGIRVKYLLLVRGYVYGDKRIVKLMKLQHRVYWDIVLYQK